MQTKGQNIYKTLSVTDWRIHELNYIRIIFRKIHKTGEIVNENEGRKVERMRLIRTFAEHKISTVLYQLPFKYTEIQYFKFLFNSLDVAIWMSG